MKKIFLFASLFIIASIAITSCVKQKFDAPPDSTNYDPNLPVNSSIWELKQKFNVVSGIPVEITDDITISGIVVADDRSGNFYKQIVIQDTSSGIVVLIGRASLYNDFPIGRKIYIKCKGLYLGAYGKFIQLGNTPDITNSLSDIPSTKIANYIVKGSFMPDSIKPKLVSINQLTSVDANAKLLGTLIQIDEAEFEGSIIGQPYAQDPNVASGTDRKIEDCALTQIVVRNSGYASFKNALLPAGKGSIKAIYSRYNSTGQLIIRDTNDVKMYGTRCSGNLNLVTIKSVKQLYPGSGNYTLGNEMKIKGIVISDKANGNISGQNIAIQDATGGIVVRFTTTTGIPSLGDEIEVNISGQTLSEYPTTNGGILQIGNLLTAKYIKTGTGTITPRIATLKQVNDSLEAWESTLVTVNNVTFPTGTYSGSKVITDATGSITLYTMTGASFATSTLPTTPVSVTAIVGQFTTTKQLSIRKLTDIQ
ncbi:MAG: hypothetical protein IPL09_12695 [Bacteroidetes bacterium]|jgi:hypothetical protein|nr:hypothetical protein [Bacteroidota bacterium]HQW47361.1 DUF5689 domain-containing protein [Chitinophagaceae bacterium]MBK7587024.1 hypothetical protein [Bacteroidota bacterium]MBK8330298.1 hypothetical protein [Bacteroidota bacterium]MBK9299925.1 hypothetical protein [Bacteroidota bacterium]